MTGNKCAYLAIRICVLTIASAMLGIVAGAAIAGERPAKGGEIKPNVLYHNYCSVCHGDRGDGRSRARNSLVPPPRDFTTAANLTREYMIAIVANGKPGTAMTAWNTQLNEKEIAAVVDYVQTAFVVGKGASVGTTAQGSCRNLRHHRSWRTRARRRADKSASRDSARQGRHVLAATQ